LVKQKQEKKMARGNQTFIPNFKVMKIFLKSFRGEIKDIGFVPFVKRLLRVSEAWYEKEDKILVGQDEIGNKYYTTSKETETCKINK
jgi:hypothetical protein